MTSTTLHIQTKQQLAADLLAQRDQLSAWSKDALINAWQELYGKKTARPVSSSLMVPMLLWQAQSCLATQSSQCSQLTAESLQSLTKVKQRYGKILQAQMNQQVQQGDVAGATENVTPPQRTLKAKHLPPGTILSREWHGRHYQVTVLAHNRFEFAGQMYKSLSNIAKHITGAHWSGPRFFGLQQLVASQ